MLQQVFGYSCLKPQLINASGYGVGPPHRKPMIINLVVDDDGQKALQLKGFGG